MEITVMRITRSSLCLVAFTFSLVFAIGRAAFAETAVVGKPAPQFALKNAAGQDVSLSLFAGKTVVLEWFNPSCPFVKKFYEGSAMQKFQKEALDKGVIWLTINSSASGRPGYIAPEEALDVAKEYGVDPARLLLDPHGITGKAYGAKTTPHMFVVDSKGTLAYAGAIDSTPSTHSEDIASSNNYVLAAIDALRQGRTPSPASTEPYGCSVKYER